MDDYPQTANYLCHLHIYPKNLENRFLGLAKASIIDGRKLTRIELTRTNLRSLRSSILGSFRLIRKADFPGSLGITRHLIISNEFTQCLFNDRSIFIEDPSNTKEAI